MERAKEDTTTMGNKESFYIQKTMLNRVKTIVEHHKQLIKIKGESFNIYNILNLKANEARTHSAFIAELLNPNGSHLMGNIFLKSFLKKLKCTDFKSHLDIKTAEVFIEFYIGLINKDLKTGGRIDILIKDVEGNTISIENKIDAEDQDYQVERYCNFNKGKNMVIYLSKNGKEPDPRSKGDLQKDIDYKLISYQVEIIKWLYDCQRICYDQPLLRESIKQYRILIQQLTQTLENKEDMQLADIVKKNLEEASLVASKYHQVVQKLKINFRDRVLENLNDKNLGFKITKQSIGKKHSHLWFYNKDLEIHKSVWFGVESFSGLGHKDGLLFVGIFDKNSSINSRSDFIQINKSWIHHQALSFENQTINLSEISFLNKLNNKETLELAAVSAAQQIENFIIEHRFLLESK